MKTLYLDCAMGAAGDMLTAALLELCGDREGFLAEMNALGMKGVAVSAEDVTKCGIQGTRVRVLVNGMEEGDEGEHHHPGHSRGQHDIFPVIDALPLSEKVKDDAKAVYKSIIEAESRVHGAPVEEAHLHEVGAMDAVADVVGVCLLMDRLAPERVAVSPVNVGGGTVRCAHGVLPVPAPATALLLEGMPVFGGEIKSELCTPTGAALLRHFADDFGPVPGMRLAAVGYGMGSKDFGAPNCVRALLGYSEDGAAHVRELCCNLDDMTGEGVGFAQEILMENGALDVWTEPIGMKKGRPGIQLRCMCRLEDADRLRALIFRHTTTLGVREYEPSRYVLGREERTEETPYGPVRVKRASFGGAYREKPEYEDMARIARKMGISLAEAAKAVKMEKD